ncbi:hypothetical protein BP5796_10647 [Coleophoma crateriformis]|uniref:Uncharacterized protein n=1 Tax=Coleophoma crateriformis TaxID=565419 RepID=A0A3D8QQS8_9HELO|nr:hypothetical protein BP5796_10647 [Coleophoma crateriformis]
MVDQLVPRPGDAAIWTSVDSKNFKQALKTVEKRLAKKPNDDYLQALKLYIRTEAAHAAGKEFHEYKEFFVELESIVAKDAVHDEEAIVLYDTVLALILPGQLSLWRDIIGTMRWNAVKASPKDAQLAITHFQSCLSNQDLAHAQVICNSLEKNFPQEHRYVLWNITLHYLKSLITSLDQKDRDMSSRMATAMIRKLAEATKTAKDVSSLPPRAIHSPQESLLLHRILESGSDIDIRLKYYEDDYTGPGSKVAKGTWKLWTDKLKLLEKAEKYDDLLEISSSLLPLGRKNASGVVVDSRMGDYTIWELFRKTANLTMEPESAYSIIMAEVDAYLKKDSGVEKVYRRNAALTEVVATFEYLKLCPQPYFSIGSKGSEEPLDPAEVHVQTTDVLLKYLSKNAHIISVFSDLRPYIGRLDVDERREFLLRISKLGKFGIEVLPFEVDDSSSESKQALAEHHLNTQEDITSCVNRYKIAYLITSSLSEIDRLASVPAENTDNKHGVPYFAPGINCKEDRFICPWCSKPCAVYCTSCLEKHARLSVLAYGSAINDNGRITSTLLPTDIHPADDFCILAAMCLVKLAGFYPWPLEEATCVPLTGDRLSHLLRASLILEYAWSHSKANSQISLLLVRLYAHLGCGSLAMRAYDRLGIKQIQTTTLAYTLFDRISSLHPHPFVHLQDGGHRTKSPMEQLANHQTTYESFAGQVSRNIFRAFEHGSYDSAVQLVGTSQFLTESDASILAFLESRRMSRITEPELLLKPEAHGFNLLPYNCGSMPFKTDYRTSFDYKSFPNFEATNCPSFVGYTALGPDVSVKRLTKSLLAERVHFHIDPRTDENGKQWSHMWFRGSFVQMHKYLSNLAHDNPSGPINTTFEQLALEVYILMGQVIFAAEEHDKADTNHLRNLTKTVQISCSKLMKLLKKISTKASVPGFMSTLHPLYMAHELAIAILNFDRYFRLSGKCKCTFVAQLQASNKESVLIAERLLKEVLSISENSRKSMDESGWIDRVLDSVIDGDKDDSGEKSTTLAGAFKATVDADFMENWAGEVVESWRDSVMGLACLKGFKK